MSMGLRYGSFVFSFYGSWRLRMYFPRTKRANYRCIDNFLIKELGKDDRV